MVPLVDVLFSEPIFILLFDRRRPVSRDNKNEGCTGFGRCYSSLIPFPVRFCTAVSFILVFILVLTAPSFDADEQAKILSDLSRELIDYKSARGLL